MDNAVGTEQTKGEHVKINFIINMKVSTSKVNEILGIDTFFIKCIKLKENVHSKQLA